MGRFAVIPAILLALLLACDDNSCEPKASFDSYQELWNQVRREPFADREAEHAALWISGELMAPVDLYNRVHDGLNTLRESWRDAVPQVETRLLLPYAYAGVAIGLSEDQKARYLESTFYELDSLLELYNVAGVYENIHDIDDLSWLTIRFKGRLNCDVLDTIFTEALPDARWVQDGRYYYSYGEPNIYAWMVADRLTFLVQESWHPPNDWSYSSRFWYFKEAGDEVLLVGSFSTNERFPEWWQEASVAYHLFTRWYVFAD
ncbi:MAG: hypothetical protein ABIJ61_08690 [bacterium]